MGFWDSFWNGLANLTDMLVDKAVKDDRNGSRPLNDEQRTNINNYKAHRRNCVKCGTAIYHNNTSSNLCTKCEKGYDKDC